MKKNNNKGFTLIEVIVTVAISTIVMLALIPFLSTVSDVFIFSVKTSDSTLMISNTKYYLRNELAYSPEIKDTIDLSFNNLEFKDGKLYKNGTQVFSNDFYVNSTIDGNIKAIGDLITIEIIVTNGDSKILETYYIKTLNAKDLNIDGNVKVIYYK